MRRVDFRVSYQPRIQHATHQQSASRRALGGNSTLRRPTGADQVLSAGNEVAKCVLLLQQLALSFVPVTAHLAATCRGTRQVLYVSNGDAFIRHGEAEGLHICTMHVKQQECRSTTACTRLSNASLGAPEFTHLSRARPHTRRRGHKAKGWTPRSLRTIMIMTRIMTT